MTGIKPQVEIEINRGFLAATLLGLQNQPMANPIWVEIEAALNRQGRTQNWLAEQLGVSNNAITKWKQSGKISRVNAIAVSQLLKINLLGSSENVFVDVLDTLPPERSKAILHQWMYMIEHADDVLTGDQIGSYLKAMSKMIKDLEKRKIEGNEKPNPPTKRRAS